MYIRQYINMHLISNPIKKYFTNKLINSNYVYIRIVNVM